MPSLILVTASKEDITKEVQHALDFPMAATLQDLQEADGDFAGKWHDHEINSRTASFLIMSVINFEMAHNQFHFPSISLQH